jgi:hypothetical protein
MVHVNAKPLPRDSSGSHFFPGFITKRKNRLLKREASENEDRKCISYMTLCLTAMTSMTLFIVWLLNESIQSMSITIYAGQNQGTNRKDPINGYGIVRPGPIPIEDRRSVPSADKGVDHPQARGDLDARAILD